MNLLISFFAFLTLHTVCTMAKQEFMESPSEVCTKEGCFKKRSMRERVKEDREKDKNSEEILKKKQRNAIQREQRKARFKKHEWLKSVEDINERLKMNSRRPAPQMSYPVDRHPAAQELRAEMEATMDYMNANNMSVSQDVIDHYHKSVTVVSQLIIEQNRYKLEQQYKEKTAAAMQKDPPTAQEFAAMKAKMNELKKLRDAETLSKKAVDDEIQFYEDIKAELNKQKPNKYTNEERQAIRKKMAADLEALKEKGTAPSYVYPAGHPKSSP